MYHHFPSREPIELDNTTSYLEVDRFIQTINCILSADLNYEDVVSTILKQLGEYLDLDRIVIYQLKADYFYLERQWVADLDQINELLSPIPARLGADNYQISEQNHLIPGDNQKTLIIEQPIFFEKDLFGFFLFERLENQEFFSLKDRYILQRFTEVFAIYIKQQINLNPSVLKPNNSQIILGNISHELRTPLAAIIGFAKMLKKQIYGELNSKQLEYITAIYDSGQHLLAISNDLLDLAKIEAEKETLFLEKIVIKEVCKEVLDLFSEKAKEQGIELILSKELAKEYCRGDRLRIKQILVNLLSNAVKFTEKGAVTLQVRTINKSTEFAVIDTGIGIKKEDQEKLFKPFSQILTPLHRKHQGTGLGLVLSRKLAQLHGGDIRMESTAGKGSCFTLYLPNSELEN